MTSNGLRFSLFILLIGCFASPCLAVWRGGLPVQDFGQQWQGGTRDESLHSYWERTDRMPSRRDYLCFAPYDQEYVVSRVYQNMLPGATAKLHGVIRVRSIQVGDRNFLMYWQVPNLLPYRSEKEGSRDYPEPKKFLWLQRYEVDGDRLTLYQLEEEAFARLLLENRIDGLIDENHPYYSGDWLKILNQRTVEALAGIADSDEKWRSFAEYTRMKDIVKPPVIKAIPPDEPEPEPLKPFNVNLPDFEYFSGAKSKVLLRHLAALPQWRVFAEKGGFICQKRQMTSGGWRATQGGHIAPPFGPDSTWKFPDRWREGKHEMFKREDFEIAYAFWFDRGPRRNWFFKDSATRVGPLAGEVDLNIVQARFGKLFSNLVIGSGNVWFSIREWRKTRQRPSTRQGLEYLAELLPQTKQNETELLRTGYVQEFGDSEVRRGKPSIEINDAFQKGIFDVCGWVNPGERGVAYLKVFATKTGKRLSEYDILKDSREVVGWSDDAEVQFYYNSHITVFEGDWEHQYDARFEIWFKPESGGPERMLISGTRSIYGWER